MNFLLTGVGKGFGRCYLNHLIEKDIGKIFAITRSLSDFSEKELIYFREKGVTFFQCDLSDLDALSDLIEKQRENFTTVDVLINNAGQRFRRELENINGYDLEELFRVNVITPFLLSRICVDGMRERRKGKIINISSILGKSGLKHLSGYAATKGALDSMTRSLAVELATDNIQVNAIAPGFCKTSYYDNFQQNKPLNEEISSRIPMKRWGEPDELNGLLDFISFGNSNYMTGQVIYLDGGWTA